MQAVANPEAKWIDDVIHYWTLYDIVHPAIWGLLFLLDGDHVSCAPLIWRHPRSKTNPVHHFSHGIVANVYGNLQTWLQGFYRVLDRSTGQNLVPTK